MRRLLLLSALLLLTGCAERYLSEHGSMVPRAPVTCYSTAGLTTITTCY